MVKIVLCGHTGSMNRGSDAIVKSTADLLSEAGMEAVLASYKKDEDSLYGTKEYSEVIRYADRKKNPTLRLLSLVFMIIKRRMTSAKIRQIPVVRYLKKNHACSLSIGGDTYCYGDLPYQYVSMNGTCLKKNITSILWACSIEKERILQPEIYDDLKRYNLIFPREKLTYENLIEAGFEKQNIIKMCDPAFFLTPETVDLAWMDDRTWVGMNISPVVSFGINPHKGLVINNYVKT
ncbi:MAG: polysaccharide pyruvyl transferase family protein, partial [Lachnospiraceae bacterium]|nr:polysaccharide pyruvyl transferase family protein [Lachnospiraceae bacterium]